MSRIALIGVAPVPVTGQVIASGPSIRTWQFVQPILEHGHELTLFALRSGNDAPAILEERTPSENFRVLEVGTDYLQQPAQIEKRIAALQPNAILGVGSILPTWAAAQLTHIAPVWADVFGDPIVELQAKAQVYPEQAVEDDQFHIYRMLRAILRRADRFSALSEAQNHALVGMLALTGRLDARTGGTPLVHTIPCGLDVRAPLTDIAALRTAARQRQGIKPEDFALCWSGSYNTWMDADTLFQGIERAMNATPHLRFLSTGGGTPIYNEAIYQRFAQRAAQSPHHPRYTLKGWVPKDEAERLQAAGDVGINIDRWTYEAVLGSRSRVLYMLNLGLPVLSTCICELTRALRDDQALFEFRVASPDDLARALTDLAQAPRERLLESAARGRDFVRRRYAFENTMKECLNWIENPMRAPDRPAGRDDKPNPILKMGDDEALRARIGELEKRPRGLREALIRFLRRAARYQ